MEQPIIICALQKTSGIWQLLGFDKGQRNFSWNLGPVKENDLNKNKPDVTHSAKGAITCINVYARLFSFYQEPLNVPLFSFNYRLNSTKSPFRTDVFRRNEQKMS